MNDYIILSNTISSAGAPERAHVRSTHRSAPDCKNELSLGTNYEIVVQNEKIAEIGRFFLQEVAREILPDHRVGNCFRKIIPGADHVKILHNEKHNRAHYGNLMVCGSIWLCAVCASKISERRKNELIQGVNNHQGGLAMITFTLRHSSGDSLQNNLNILNTTIHKMTSGGWFQRFKKNRGIIGSVSNLEITYGQNGWHPHRHILYFFRSDITGQDLEKIRSEITDRYLYLLRLSGGSGLDRVAVDVQEAKTEKQKFAEYMAKIDKKPWGIEAEMTKSHVKYSPGGGLSYWELLNLASTGEYKYILLVREYAKVTKGKQSLYYSKGLRKILGLGKIESDLEVAEKIEENSIELAIIAREIWLKITRLKLRGQLLQVSNNGDLSQIEAFLQDLYSS